MYYLIGNVREEDEDLGGWADERLSSYGALAGGAGRSPPYSGMGKGRGCEDFPSLVTDSILFF